MTGRGLRKKSQKQLIRRLKFIAKTAMMGTSNSVGITLRSAKNGVRVQMRAEAGE